MSKIDRRDFIKIISAASLGLLFPACKNKKTITKRKKLSKNIIVVGKGKDYKALTESVIDKWGGLSQIINKGDKVLIKPNIGWARRPEQAATTHPDIVQALVEMAYKAGADTVYVMDRSINVPTRSYLVSGIKRAAKSANAVVKYISNNDSAYKRVKIDKGLTLSDVLVYKKLDDFDVKINVPILKDHNLSKLSIAMKNTMGLIGGDRGHYHRVLDKAIVDFNKAISYDLIVIDATRVLKSNGPTGVSLNDVEVKDTIIVGNDIVALDAYAAHIFGTNPLHIPYITLAHKHHLGNMNWKALKLINA